jgi:uncharacterized protein with HEPN domain
MARKLADRLRHIVAAIERIEIYLAGKSFVDYQSDHMRRYAVERYLESCATNTRSWSTSACGKS